MYKLAQLEPPSPSRLSIEELMWRRSYYAKKGFKELVGCYNELYGKENDNLVTMAWRIKPFRKCKKHPRYWVRVALVKREQTEKP